MTDVTLAAAERSTDTGFVGTYLQTIDVEGIASFDGVLLVQPHGGIVATSADYRSDVALGTWERTGPSAFVYTIHDFTFVSAEGEWRGRHVITTHATVTGDELAGDFVVDHVDREGNVTRFKTGHLTGKRISAWGAQARQRTM